MKSASRASEVDTDGRAPLGIAVVGLGYWGPNLVRNLNELAEADVVLACDRRVEAVEALARRFPAIRGTTDVEEVFEDPSVEAVIVATPVSTHHALALSALMAGKHVFVEKPLAASSTQALELVETATRCGLVLMPGHIFLYSPPVRMIRDVITSGELGEIYFISTRRVNLGIHEPDVSVVSDLGPHDFSILRYWLDELPSKVAAMTSVTPNMPDVAFIHLVFGSGTIANVEIAWLAPSRLRLTTIVGSEKMLVYDDTSAEPVRIFNSGAYLQDPQTFGEFQLAYRTGDIVSPKVEVTEPLAHQLQDFCAAIRNGTVPLSSAAFGLDVVTITEAVERSLSLDGCPVAVESKQVRIGESARTRAPLRPSAS